MPSLHDWLIVIPSRLASQRLPEKPLQDLCGKPLMVRVYEAVQPLAEMGAKVVVAVEAQKAMDIAHQHGLPVELTGAQHESGTDRCYEIAQRYPHPFIMNVQGDEPFTEAKDLVALAEQFVKASNPMGTLAFRTPNGGGFDNPNVVKVVLDKHQQAIYFSRSGIPFHRDASLAKGQPTAGPYWQHLGFYCFRRPALTAFCGLPPSPLEQLERLEQLRAVDDGWKILVVPASTATLAIDTPGDLEAARKKFAAAFPTRVKQGR